VFSLTIFFLESRVIMESEVLYSSFGVGEANWIMHSPSDEIWKLDHEQIKVRIN
jgi:hypothetical protein